jgi:prepilin-type N-terminal cleavage/methylation domain-containing protein
MKRSSLYAFTLIELLIVLALISIVFFIATPRFISSVNPEKTRNFVLRLQNTLIYLNDKSILESSVYLFNIDLDEKQYYFTISEEGNPEGEVRDRYLVPVMFPSHTLVSAIKTIPGDEVSDGKVTIPFTPNGMLFSFEITVEEDEDRRYIIVGNSFSNRIRVLKVSGEKRDFL